MTRESFHGKLDQLEADVVAMSQLARGMLLDGLHSLETMDKDLAAQVAARTDQLSDLDEKVETGALKILALQAPVAKDLRRVGAMLKIITYLNRIGRYGYDIAKAVPDLPAKGIQGIGLVSIRQMGRNVERMLDLSLDAYRRHEAPDTKAIMAIEDEVDKQRFSVWREATAFMLQDPRNIEPCSHVMMVARYLERCGDNVVKIAEKQHYAATGERLRL